MAVPWEGRNPLKVEVALLALTCVIVGVVLLIVHLTGHSKKTITSEIVLLTIVMSVAVPLINQCVRLLVNRFGRKLEGNALLRSDCMIVYGSLEMPGVAAVVGNELVIKPLVGREVRVELSRITSVSEHRFWNCRPYLGTARFFSLSVPKDVSKKWRLGFGVANAEPWKPVLLIRR